MKIFEEKNKNQHWDLLLLADEQESMVEKYLYDGTMYVLDDNGIKGEIVILSKWIKTYLK